MKPKQHIIDLVVNDQKQNWAYGFVLAWARFFTYEELEMIEQLEPYDAEVLKGKVKSKKDWNKLVIPYTEDNIKKAMCIALNKAVSHMLSSVDKIRMIYVDDIKRWLFILDDKSFEYSKINENDDASVKKFYNDVAKKYKFDIAL